MAATALRRLLEPLELELFLCEHWDRAMVHVPGSPERFRELPAIDDVPALVAGSLAADNWRKATLSAQGSFVDQNGKVHDIGTVPSSMFAPLYNAGVSLCFASLGADDARIKGFVQAVKDGLVYPGEIGLTAYLTPPNSGSNMHFDSQHVFLLQVAGEKLWRVSTTPAVHAPPNNLGAAALRSQAVRETLRRRNLAVVPPEDMQFAELHVTPGDVLYLPPGTWHEPRTLTRSLHYTLTLFPVSMSQVLLAVLRALMTGESRWRRDLRFTDGANTSEARMLALIREALQELATDLAQVSPESVLRRAFPSGTRQPADGEAEE